MPDFLPEALALIATWAGGFLVGRFWEMRYGSRSVRPWRRVADTAGRSRQFMRGLSMEDRIPTTSSLDNPENVHARVRKARW